MDRRSLERLVANGEGQRLEFKRKVRHPDKIAREFVAFANSGGGTILIGVGDDGEIAGLKDPLGEAYILEQWLEKHVSPPLPFQRAEIDITSSRKVLYYKVESGEEKPYRIEASNDFGQLRKLAYVRLADMSVRASRELTQILRFSKRDKGVNIQVGEREKILLQHLEHHQDITLASAQKLLNLNKRKTSGLLVLLTRAGLLNIQASEKGDRYSLAQEAFES